MTGYVALVGGYGVRVDCEDGEALGRRFGGGMSEPGRRCGSSPSTRGDGQVGTNGDESRRGCCFVRLCMAQLRCDDCRRSLVCQAIPKVDFTCVCAV
jgi:hypothetical protein